MCPQNWPKIVDAVVFFFCSFLHFFLEVVLWTHRPFVHKSETTFLNSFPSIFFLFSSLNSKKSRNMCNLRHKVRNGYFYPHGSPNFKIFQSMFSNTIFAFHFRPSKTYSLNPCFKKILGLYVLKALNKKQKNYLKNLN